MKDKCKNCKKCNGKGGDFPSDGSPFDECRTCRGTGVENKDNTCPECKGKKGYWWTWDESGDHAYWEECEVCDGTGVKKEKCDKKCPECNGQGGLNWEVGDHVNWDYCDKCGGTGEINEDVEPANSVKDTRSIYKRAVDLWGQPTQIDMAIEECAELIKQLSKIDRRVNGSDEYKVAEEVADVEIMMEQLRYIIGADKVDVVKRRKLERLLNLIKYGEGTA